jgi:proline racemase
MIRVIKSIDAHVGGQPLRLIVDGMPRPHGKASLPQREWYLKHADAYRRALVNPPEGTPTSRPRSSPIRRVFIPTPDSCSWTTEGIPR